MMEKRLTGLSLFASAGIGETYFKDVGIDIKVANELLENEQICIVLSILKQP